MAAELKRLKKVLMSAVLGPDESALTSGKKEPSKDDMIGVAASKDLQPGQLDQLLKRLTKFKHLEEDNKKLKSLLKDQLEKSELLR